ncbi:MAG TPA: ABC transporter permease subunit [Anaerolineae bacterium]|nr:ABC transporter permease subunit [Anaerolineae bacterium]
MTQASDEGQSNVPRAVKILLALVTVTALLSLAYAAQYYLGGPLRLSVVSPFADMEVGPKKNLLAAGAQDGAVRVWELPKKLPTGVGRDFDIASQAAWPVHRLVGSGAPVIDVAFARDGSRLFAVTGDGKLWTWDLKSYGAESQLDLAGAPLLDADWDAERTSLATLGQDGSVRVWDLATRQEVRSVDSAGGAVIAVDAAGTRVAAGSGSKIKIWDIKTGEELVELDGYLEQPEDQDSWMGHTKEVTALVFSPDGDTLVSGGADADLLQWDLETGKITAESEGHWSSVTSLLFDDLGTTLLTGSKDTKARTFRMPAGKGTAIYEGHLGTITAVAYGPTTDSIFSAGSDGTVRAWESANQYVTHLEWSRAGLQPSWGRILAVWLLLSGVLGLLCVWGLRRSATWSHLLTLALFLLGPIVVLGVPVFEVLTYPLQWSGRLRIGWPLLALLLWYLAIVVVLTRRSVVGHYEAPRQASLSRQLMVSQQTAKLRFGLFTLAVWFGLLVLLYSVLRRFNLDVSFMGHYLPFIMKGAGLTLGVSAISIVLAVILALLGALGRLSRNAVANGISGFYISLIRGTPLLVQIYIWYLGLPRLNIVLDAVVAGVLALGVNYGAYMTEIFRAGIQAIGKGQHEAASALGMSRAQTLRKIVLPQAFRIVIPPIGNEFIAMMKDSSLVSVMAVWELTYRAQKIGRQYFRNMETFIIAAAFYWILTVVFQALQGRLEEYMARGERR